MPAVPSTLEAVPEHFVTNGLDAKVGSLAVGTDLAALQASTSAGAGSMHLMDEAPYLNPETALASAAPKRFEKRDAALRTLECGTHEYDVIVVGAGAGISKIASPASKLGYSVALVDRARLGGTCLNRGCIPSKMLIHPAEVADVIQHAKRFHIHVDGWRIDTESLVRETSKAIDDVSFGIEAGMPGRQLVDWYHGSARFADAHTIVVNGKERVTAPRIFLVTGSRPWVPPIPGLVDVPYATSTEALRIIAPPTSIIIIGGGFISCELAFYFGTIGWDITIISHSELLMRADESVQKEFQKLFLERFPKTQLNCSPTHVAYDKASKKFSVATEYRSDGRKVTFSADRLLVATGVRGNADMLGAEAVGIKVKRGNYIQVDGCLRSSVPGVWAFGEAAGNFFFRHSANFEGEYLFQHIFHMEKFGPGHGTKGSLLGKESYPPITYTGMPYAVFTGNEMQIGSVGITEAEARALDKPYFVGLNTYRACAYGDALRSTSGFFKIMVDGERTILGVHAIGYQASVLVHQLIALFRIEGGPKLDHVLGMIFVHPALPELVRNAARKARDALVKAGIEVPASILYC